MVTINDCTVYVFNVPKNPVPLVGVRVTHQESGASGVSVRFKSQHKNKLEAFKRMKKEPKFREWVTKAEHTVGPQMGSECRGTCDRAIMRHADDSALYLNISCNCKIEDE